MPREITIKSALNKTKRRDPWFLDDYTVNPYSSCSFNCLYCYIRGSKYGHNLEESLSAKRNLAEILDKQLASRAKKNQYGYIVLSSATDPYLPTEKKVGLTREALKVITKHRFPVHIITKSTLVTRDFDLLHEINEKAIIPEDLPIKYGTIISFSFSTLDDSIGKIFEPGAAQPTDRLEGLKKTISEGFLSGVSMMPLLPFISDTTAHLELLFDNFKKAKVDYLLPATLTLFGHGSSDSKTLILNAIRQNFKHLEPKYRKYFQNNNEMPAYYQQAFREKMAEMARSYDLSLSIIEGASKKLSSAVHRK